MTLPPSITTIGKGVFQECTSLTSVHLPENLTKIACTAFDQCPKLFTVTASAFSTTTLEKGSTNGFRKFLREAGFSTENPIHISNGRPTRNVGNEWYYETKKWSRSIGVDGRLPLLTAAERSLKWHYTEKIFAANMPVIQETDALSGLPPFMLAAAGPDSDMESIYNLLKEYPALIRVTSHRHEHISSDITRKRGWGSKFAQGSNIKIPKM